MAKIIEVAQYELIKPYIVNQSAIETNGYPNWIALSYGTKWTFSGIENGRPMYRKAGKVSQPKKQR